MQEPLMWSALCADARLYSALRWPRSSGSLIQLLIWIRSPGLLVLAFQRVDHCYHSYRQSEGWTGRTLGLRLLLAFGRWPVAMLAKSDVAAATEIGAGVYLSDLGQLILGPQRIGSGTVIHDRVTIGMRASELETPIIGRNVWIGPDCVIYGSITIGDGATVLPGSVVSMNVRPGAVVGGNPATLLHHCYDNERLRRTRVSEIDGKFLESV
jgi:serine acetyltransferase